MCYQEPGVQSGCVSSLPLEGNPQRVVRCTLRRCELTVSTTYSTLFRGDYKHWTWTWTWTGDRRPKDQGPKCLAVFYLAFMTEVQLQTTCVNVLSSNLRLCRRDSESALLNTQKVLFTPVVLFHIISHLPLSFLHPANPIIASFVACNTTSVTIYTQGPRVKGHIQIVSRRFHFVRASWPLQKHYT